MTTCSIDGCGRDGEIIRGWCEMHYHRWTRHGDPAVRLVGGRPAADPHRRALAKFAVGDECWLWTGTTNPAGYGQLSRRRPGPSVLAHRFIYEWLVGPIPEGLELDHLCRVHSCVRPDHLEPVTHAENMRRSLAYRTHKTHCPQGHPYDEANTYVYRGRRNCRACAVARSRDYYRSSKQEATA